MGRHGCGTINENGERLVEFFTTNDLVIGGTLFPHREIHKITWCSPNGRDRNQIDHLLINGKWRRSLRDVKVRRGADVGSDHHLVTACLKLKLKSAGRPAKGRSRFDVGQLKQPSVRKSFILEVRNRFEALVEMDEQEDNIDDGVNRNWKNIVTAYSESSKACLGYRQHPCPIHPICNGSSKGLTTRHGSPDRQYCTIRHGSLRPVLRKVDPSTGSHFARQLNGSGFYRRK